MSSKQQADSIRYIHKQCPYSCTFNFWGRYVSVHADESETVNELRCVYKHFICTLPGSIDLECCIVRNCSSCGSPAFFVGDLFYPLPNTPYFLGHAELVLFRHLFDMLDDYIVLHAGVAARQGRAVVAYGQSGFGKTTLTLELLRRGYDFMSDEFCPVRLSDFMVEPFERLVSIRRTSPLYPRIQSERMFARSSRDKDFFDCSSADPAHAAQACRVGAFIEICGTVDSSVCPPGGLVLDIYLCTERSSVPDALRRLPGVIFQQPAVLGRYPVLRVTAADRTAFVVRFNSIWKQYAHEILGVFPYRGEVGSFDRIPVMRQINNFDAVSSVMANMVNRSPAGRLLASFGGKNAQLVMLLGGLFADIPCYSLQPGRLDKMADLIDSISM